MLDWYISHHPVYYGLEQIGKKLGVIDEKKNITDGLMKYANLNKKDDDSMVGSFIHPLYVQLQQESPMGMMKDFKIAEIDTKEKEIGLHEFYDQHLSKSLPLVLRHACEDWGMYKVVKKGDLGMDLEPYF
jgi:hypothetical protein